MAIYLCHEEPDLRAHAAEIVAARPGAVVLSRSAFHPGGGGQVPDRGAITCPAGSFGVAGVEVEVKVEVDGERWWHLLMDPTVELPVGVAAEVTIDGEHRLRVASLHTTSHVLNALVFQEFHGALVTGAQINGDGTGRMDFDLPEVDNARLRALEDPVNAVIARGVEVRSIYVDAAESAAQPGLLRSLAVAPPPTLDGRLRVIDIAGVDRQACGGTHLANTAQSPPMRITKVENKGRRNRRVRFELAR